MKTKNLTELQVRLDIIKSLNQILTMYLQSNIKCIYDSISKIIFSTLLRKHKKSLQIQAHHMMYIQYTADSF